MLFRLYCELQVTVSGVRRRLEEEHGATAVEYAIMLGFIAAIIVVAVAFLGQTTNAQFEKVTFEAP